MHPKTVFAAFSATAAAHPEKPFLCTLPETAVAYGIMAGEITYGQAAKAIERLRQSYQAAGYGAGHRVGLLLENRPSFFLHWFALNALGVSVVPINADLRAAELEYLIGHSEIALAVALSERHNDLSAAAARAGRPLALMADAPSVPPAPFPAPDAPGELGRATEAALLYTSGTTGRPKGCILTNTYFLEAGTWYTTIGGACALRTGVERMVTPLPVIHMNAMAFSAMAMVMSAGCLIPLDRFHPKSWWDSVRESRATVVHYLGVMPAMLMGAAPKDADKAHAVRFGFGAGVDKRLQAPFEERFGFPLIEAWAMTETGAGAVIVANKEPRHVGSNCFGRAEPAILTRIVDDSGQDVGPDQPGELLVRHAGADARHGFFAAYLKDAKATDEAWDGGWFHTGDIVRRTAEGDFHFVDRKKNVIRRSGENIAAIEVESVLMQHPGIHAVGVAGVPDAIRGDEVMACIVPKAMAASEAERTAQATEIVAWCLTQLAYYKAPGFIAFVPELPLTTTNKIQRGELKALALALLAQPGCIDTCAMKKRQA